MIENPSFSRLGLHLSTLISCQRKSSELGVEAQRSWRRGDLRANPRGKPLPGGGNHAYSYWGRIFYYRTYDIAGRFDEFVDKVHDHKRFVTRLIKDGGRVKIILTLAGSLHAGFMFHGSTLDKISELGIEIGVEVFPDMETEQIDTDSF